MTYDDGTSNFVYVYKHKRLPDSKKGWYRIRVPRKKTKSVKLEIVCLFRESLKRGHGIAINEIQAWVLGDGKFNQDAPKGKLVSIKLTPGNKPEKPWREVANCYQMDYREHGVSDALVDKETGKELIKLLREMNVQGLRFPGGFLAYVYLPEKESQVDLYPIWKQGPRAYPYQNWPSPKDFFRFCKKGGFLAMYQINPAFWYDKHAGRVYRTRSFSGTSYFGVTDEDHLPDAVNEVKQLAKWCSKNKINVLWEVGNEDAPKFNPEDFAEITDAFIKGIKEVDPDARFVVYGDSYSWSDHSYQNKFLPALKKQGIKSFDYSSVHVYLNTGNPPKNGQDFITNTIKQWNDLRHLFFNSYQKNVWKHGFKKAEMFFNEFNIVHSPRLTDLSLEHCAGRGLAEAILYPWVWNIAGICYHDLVRNGRCFENWFQRLDYYPDFPAGRRYYLQVDGQMIRLIGQHCKGRVIYASTNHRIVATRQTNGVYVTIVNTEKKFKPYKITIDDNAFTPKNVVKHCVYVKSPDSKDYDYYLNTEKLRLTENESIKFIVKPYSVTAINITEKE